MIQQCTLLWRVHISSGKEEAIFDLNLGCMLKTLLRPDNQQSGTSFCYRAVLLPSLLASYAQWCWYELQ